MSFEIPKVMAMQNIEKKFFTSYVLVFLVILEIDYLRLFGDFTYSIGELYKFLFLSTLNKLLIITVIYIPTYTLYRIFRKYNLNLGIFKLNVFLGFGSGLVFILFFIPWIKRIFWPYTPLSEFQLFLSLSTSSIVILIISIAIHTFYPKTQSMYVLIPSFVGIFLIVILQPFILHRDYKVNDLLHTSNQQSPNVIFMMVDTLRADRLSIHGHNRKTSPNLNHFTNKKQTVLYKKAFAPAPWTKPSMVSIFSGLYPQVHSARGELETIPRQITTLPMLFKKNKYNTFGIITNPYMKGKFGFQRGFDRYYEHINEHPLEKGLFYIFNKELYSRGFPFIFLYRTNTIFNDANYVNSVAKEYIRAHQKHAESQPFFMYLHYMDTHYPYYPPENHLPEGKMKRNVNLSKYIKKHSLNGAKNYHRIYPFYKNPEPPKQILKNAKYRYDAEIRYWDEQFGDFYNFLERKNLLKDTIIIVTSDHGEEFFEHGNWFHAHSVFNELIHVPLVVSFPESSNIKNQVIKENVSNIHLKSSLHNLIDKSTDEPILPNFARTETENYEKYTIGAYGGRSGNNSYFTIIEDNYKVMRIRDSENVAWKLFNLETDFQEQKDISNVSEGIFEPLKKKLLKWNTNLKKNEIKSKGQKSSVGGLEGLGYVD